MLVFLVLLIHVLTFSDAAPDRSDPGKQVVYDSETLGEVGFAFDSVQNPVMKAIESITGGQSLADALQELMQMVMAPFAPFLGENPGQSLVSGLDGVGLSSAISLNGTKEPSPFGGLFGGLISRMGNVPAGTFEGTVISPPTTNKQKRRGRKQKGRRRFGWAKGLLDRAKVKPEKMGSGRRRWRIKEPLESNHSETHTINIAARPDNEFLDLLMPVVNLTEPHPVEAPPLAGILGGPLLVLDHECFNDTDCGDNGYCIERRFGLLTSKFCGCVRGMSRDPVAKACVTDPLWCNGHNECTDREMCCNVADCGQPTRMHCVDLFPGCPPRFC